MILYFSGSGNSEYVAKFLADKLNDKTINLANYLKSNQQLRISSEKPYVIVAPVYVSVLPLIIEKLLLNSTLNGNKNIYFIMTCAGSGSSSASVSAKKVCKKLNLNLMGVTHLSMPQNYLMYFKTASKEENDKKFDAAINNLPKIYLAIEKEEKLDIYKPSLAHKMMASRPIVVLFEKMLYGCKKFTVNDKCVSCGLCEKNCPINAIKIIDGRPQWIKKRCLHCTACINKCPKHAIEYSNKTQGKPRYVAKAYISSKNK